MIFNPKLVAYCVGLGVAASSLKSSGQVDAFIVSTHHTSRHSTSRSSNSFEGRGIRNNNDSNNSNNIHVNRFVTSGTNSLFRDIDSSIRLSKRQSFLLRKSNRDADDEDDDEDDDDDDYDEYNSGPLSKGIDSVSWLPTVVGKRGAGLDQAVLSQKDSVIIPLFPLGSIVYTPNSEHILNIFEPRYRQMYSDILLNGTKRFAVSMSHPTEPGRFAQMAVLFELQDLKEVSEQTGDRIKYICKHKVTGRVRLHQVFNPEAWQSRETYLRVEGTIIDDSAPSAAATTTDEAPSLLAKYLDPRRIKNAAMSNLDEESKLRKCFAALVDLQTELQEDVRFNRWSVLTLATKPGSGEDGLWQTIKLWQSFIEQRLLARQHELQRDFQKKLQDFLKKEKGLKQEEIPSAIGFQDLSPDLQREVTELQKRMATELQPLVLESTLTMQKILEAPDHTERVKLMQYFILAEKKRLETKKVIKSMFSSSSLTGGASETSSTGSNELSSSLPTSKTEQITTDSEPPSISSSTQQQQQQPLQSPSSFFSEDDAFQ